MGNRKWTGESLLAREELNDELKRDRLGSKNRRTFKKRRRRDMSQDLQSFAKILDLIHFGIF